MNLNNHTLPYVQAPELMPHTHFGIEFLPSVEIITGGRPCSLAEGGRNVMWPAVLPGVHSSQ